MKRSMLINIGIICTLLFSVWGIGKSQSTLWPVVESHHYELGANPGYVPKGDELRPVLFGFDTMVADLYWIQAVLYAGGNAREATYTALPEYLELVTDLDPHFLFAYEFGGARLLRLNPETRDDALRLLQKGMQENPKHVEFPVQIAFHLYFYDEKYEDAVVMYETCLQDYSDCPEYVRGRISLLQKKDGHYAAALHDWLLMHWEMQQGAEATEEERLFDRVEESSKMVAVECAKQNYQRHAAEHPGQYTEITGLEDLLGLEALPCPLFDDLPPELRDYLFALNDKYGFSLRTITEETLRSPFEASPFFWNEEEQRVDAKIKTE